ncbi:hypothetical protein J6590_074879 [Homalodisca vitripennis]|nr:hypothetical protein J6590_074879 [Homalodisca vitripennis]
MESKNPNAKVNVMDFRINVIRQILEAHVAPREETAAVTRPLGGAQQPLSLSCRRKLKRCFVCSNTTRGERNRKETAYECTKCEAALCVYPCFEQYHTFVKF